ncbi:hypothetical protein D3C73_1657920 [compost metagenome]
MRLEGGIIGVDLIEPDQIGIAAILQHIEHQAAGLITHRSGSVDAHGIHEGAQATGTQTGLEKKAVHF